MSGLVTSRPHSPNSPRAPLKELPTSVRDKLTGNMSHVSTFESDLTCEIRIHDVTCMYGVVVKTSLFVTNHLSFVLNRSNRLLGPPWGSRREHGVQDWSSGSLVSIGVHS